MKLHNGRVLWQGGRPLPVTEPIPADPGTGGQDKTMAYRILRSHATEMTERRISVRFDSLISHDITYVGIIQSARAGGMRAFPVPYVLTNCHNSLCAVGGTINEDDHAFGLSAARKYGGIYVPANQAVIHQYAREMLAKGGGMVLGSDSHTRYGPLGTLGVGEGGPELVKQLLRDTYDIPRPRVILVYVTGTPRHGVGPHDVAIALCGAVYQNGFVKNAVMEFAGPGIASLSMDYRFGIDVMTTETTCLSSVWETDGRVEAHFRLYGRGEDYVALAPQEGACYDGMIELDLSAVEPMAALPFHPSEAVSIRELTAHPAEVLREVERRAEAQFGRPGVLSLTDKVKDGKLHVDQGIIAGCAGGMYDNIVEADAILRGAQIGDGYFNLSVYPSSMPVKMELLSRGIEYSLSAAGALFKPCFCGPCFGAGEVPANHGLSVRHTTRNFPNREGSRPADGQLSAVMLLDARSIAATAARGGVLTSAADIDYTPPEPVERRYDPAPYHSRVYQGYGKPDPSLELKFGPNITDWPSIPALPQHLLLELASVIMDEVTTTDELIPSGETSSYRSNPLKLATFTLSRRDPDYVPRTRAIRQAAAGELPERYRAALARAGFDLARLPQLELASAIFARRPGDGSAREQAASCQRVLGGAANLCYEYATKRYRSNCINWGILPFTLDPDPPFSYGVGDLLLLTDIRAAVAEGRGEIPAQVITQGGVYPLGLHLQQINQTEKEILLSGCLMNWYAAKMR